MMQPSKYITGCGVDKLPTTIMLIKFGGDHARIYSSLIAVLFAQLCVVIRGYFTRGGV